MLAACFLLLAPLAAAAPLQSPAHWSVKSTPAKAAKRGARVDVVLAGQLDAGWHVYALEEPEGGPIPTEVTLTEGDAAEVERVSEGKPRVLPDPAFGKPTGYFEGTAEFTLHLRIARDAAPGPHTLHALVRYQSCSGQMCLAPRTETVEVPIVVSP